MQKNRIREALDKRDLALGTWVQMKNAEACELVAAAGYDFVIIDMEHGSFGWDGAVDMIRAVQYGRATPVIRLPGDSIADIKKALDAGALGVIIPKICTGQEALQVVKAAKYEPLGKRGACPVVRATAHGLLDWKMYSKWSDKNVMVWAIIETMEAVENIAEIVSQGLDAIVLGPFDLSMAMGLHGDVEHPDVKRELSRIAGIALKKGVECVAVLFDMEPEQILKSAKFWKGKGCRMITTSSDRGILSHFHKKVLTSLQDLSK
jgi:2-keto-3-deoxy-L-rhamnonate aldolase RhmA